MVTDEEDFTNLQFRLWKEKHMPEGFEMVFEVEVKGYYKNVFIRGENSTNSEIMHKQKLKVRNVDGLW